MTQALKRTEFVGSSLKDLQKFPKEVKEEIGFALYRAQEGKKHPNAKPLTGFSGASVLEIVENFDGDTYRAVYTVRFEGVVYVLHAFQKKSKKGISTTREDMALVKSRLKDAEKHYKRK